MGALEPDSMAPTACLTEWHLGVRVEPPTGSSQDEPTLRAPQPSGTKRLKDVPCSEATGPVISHGSHVARTRAAECCLRQTHGSSSLPAEESP